jgi:Leucine-rich repeat (LRR) protein
VVGALTAELIKMNLSQCGKAGSSGRKAFALQRLEVRGKSLHTFDADVLELFKDLQYVSLANNEYASLAPLKALENLVLLDAQKNSLTSIIDFGGELKHMQILQVDFNQIEDLTGYNLASLKTLTLSNNLVTGFKGLTSERSVQLQVLDLSNNAVADLDGIGYFQELRVLNLYGNKLESLEGVQELPNLHRLNVGENHLQPADLDILAEMSLTHLVIANNAAIDAFIGEGALLNFVYDRMPDLQDLNGVPVTKEQRQAAQETKNAARRAAEDEARAAAAAADVEAAEAAAEAVAAAAPAEDDE